MKEGEGMSVAAFFGIGAIALSIVTLASAQFTGYTISSDSVLSSNFKTLGIILFLGGLALLFMSGNRKGNLEEEAEGLRVYIDKRSGGREIDPRQDYFLSDPQSYFGTGGVSLGKAIEDMDDLRKTSPELAGQVRRSYAGPLLRLVDSPDSNPQEARIAKEFLGAMGLRYDDAENTGIQDEDKEELYNTLKTWDGRRITPRIRQVMTRLGFRENVKANRWDHVSGGSVPRLMNMRDIHASKNHVKNIQRFLEGRD
jgi:hypothetical protein